MALILTRKYDQMHDIMCFIKVAKYNYGSFFRRKGMLFLSVFDSFICTSNSIACELFLAMGRGGVLIHIVQVLTTF